MLLIVQYLHKKYLIYYYRIITDVYKRQVPVKMLVTRARTERPHGALLQFDTGIRSCMYRIGGRRRRMDASLSGVAVGIPPVSYTHLYVYKRQII